MTHLRLARSLDRQLKAADDATAEDLRETIKMLLAEWVPWRLFDIPRPANNMLPLGPWGLQGTSTEGQLQEPAPWPFS